MEPRIQAHASAKPAKPNECLCRRAPSVLSALASNPQHPMRRDACELASRSWYGEGVGPVHGNLKKTTWESQWKNRVNVVPISKTTKITGLMVIINHPQMVVFFHVVKHPHVGILMVDFCTAAENRASPWSDHSCFVMFPHCINGH